MAYTRRNDYENYLPSTRRGIYHLTTTQTLTTSGAGNIIEGWEVASQPDGIVLESLSEFVCTIPGTYAFDASILINRQASTNVSMGLAFIINSAQDSRTGEQMIHMPDTGSVPGYFGQSHQAILYLEMGDQVHLNVYMNEGNFTTRVDSESRFSKVSIMRLG